MIQFKHTLYHAVVIRGQDEGQNHDQFLQGDTHPPYLSSFITVGFTFELPKH